MVGRHGFEIMERQQIAAMDMAMAIVMEDNMK
jgi:hypothetical protein